MNGRGDQDTDETRIGLCFDCAFGREIESERGSIFYLCELAASDPSYAKYPRLPVLGCAGYKRKARPSRDSL
jgi:hypothetical protein